MVDFFFFFLARLIDRDELSVLKKIKDPPGQDTTIFLKDDFKNQLAQAGDKLVVVDFTASWCGPCKMIGPIFHQLAESQENANVIFLSVDVDDVEEVSSSCGISCMPTFQFYKNTEKVDEFSGSNAETLKEKIMKHR
ncbi:thioredoxin isoform X1 [Acanthopagrus latus]|uniref:thioredoxin isoform X1 n=1 Tax=Acanthopagrus latus TaxID=8177 RepID=UPI00187CBE63|nr:thioredoxin isoform X1 [Acanthopagrus latus]